MGGSPGRQALPAERDENFPVALRVLPQALRDDLHAVYEFARTVDDLGDRAPGDRTRLLTGVRHDLRRIWDGEVPDLPVLQRLSTVVLGHDLDLAPFDHLVEANLVDQQVTRYRTFDDLLGYCRLSADPVGRIVLGLLDHRDPATAVLSDRVCTALQLLEHWQDVGEDRRAGRVYLPLGDLEAFGVPLEDLDATTTSERLRALLRFETERAACLLESGAPIVRELHGWGRVAVAGYVAGGRATVAALRRNDLDVLARQVRPRRSDVVTEVFGLLSSAALHHRLPRLHALTRTRRQPGARDVVA
ncbi:MAG TPA: squalene synthase HpnC [Actinomycetales bacterium]|nr:squalene synthase HpnC [Actinomycetales bacterium]